MRLSSLAAWFLAAFTLPSAHAQEAVGGNAAGPGTSVLTVRGAGSFEQPPDYGRFEVNVVTREKTLEAAVAAHEKRASAAITALRSFEPAGVGIEKSRFRLDEERPVAYPSSYYPGHQPPPKLSATPFTATTTFTLKVTSIADLNKTMSRIAETGLFQIQSVTFKVENERAALLEARRAAMTDARQQARVYTEAADLTLLEITTITDGEASPSEVGQADMPRSARFIQLVPPAKVSFDASVRVTWRIAPR